MPNFRNWAENTVGIDLNKTTPVQETIPINPPVINEAFLEAIRGKVNEVTNEKT